MALPGLSPRMMTIAMSTIADARNPMNGAAPARMVSRSEPGLRRAMRFLPRHKQADLFTHGQVMGELLDDPPFEDDADPIRQGEKLVQIGGDQEDRAACRPRGQELLVNELRGADIHSPRGLGGDKEDRARADFPRHNGLLLVSPGERVCRRILGRRPYVVLGNDLARVFPYCFLVD